VIYTYLHKFKGDITGICLPEKFTNPFNYEPHPLSQLAACEVQSYLSAQEDWEEELKQGKMFGVLVVLTAEGIRFMAAYSGLLCGRNDLPYFVPPVYDLLNPNGHFKQEEAYISAINQKLRDIGFNKMEASQAKALKLERKRRSIALQHWIFERFIILNRHSERRTINQIFLEARHKAPPSGAGECSAPKLLQQCFLHHWVPICMAEFWWGEDSTNQNRQHGHYYPACEEKCRPILEYMLETEYMPTT